MDFTTALIAENAAFADLLRDADLSIPVPTCPEWTLEQLMRHVGRGDRWCAQIVAEQSMDFIDPRTVAGGKPPAGRDNEIDWLHAGAQQLVDAVAQTGAETPVWTFLGPRPAKWWIRRRLHEIVVHRADAAIALGADFDVDPAVAADAITEWLERVVDPGRRGRPRRRRPAARGRPVATPARHRPRPRATPVSGPSSGAPTASPSTTNTARPPPRCAGRRADLLLAVVRRRTAAEEGLEVFGDPGVWDTWLARTPF